MYDRKDFKDACLDNISSIERTNKTLFSLQNSIEKQFSSFTNHIIDELHYTMNQIDEINLLKLVNDIKKSKRIYGLGICGGGGYLLSCGQMDKP